MRVKHTYTCNNENQKVKWYNLSIFLFKEKRDIIYKQDFIWVKEILTSFQE